ncbi:hypothetical protein SAMN04515674_11834 [Pseudarcicella hirudinis]|uniref:Uncharacterized protein n=1 Tax=Pseudarcicella hirudinis TaxID=1079859 RepID=A0A1I5YDG3_9BACT|nr:hypothetical protein SAMN04515674_11834 [Pseudarcicella hirudinis]
MELEELEIFLIYTTLNQFFEELDTFELISNFPVNL